MILLFVGDELLKEVVSFVFGTSNESLKMQQLHHQLIY